MTGSYDEIRYDTIRTTATSTAINVDISKVGRKSQKLVCECLYNIDCQDVCCPVVTIPTEILPWRRLWMDIFHSGRTNNAILMTTTSRRTVPPGVRSLNGPEASFFAMAVPLIDAVGWKISPSVTLLFSTTKTTATTTKDTLRFVVTTTLMSRSYCPLFVITCTMHTLADPRG